MSTASHRSRATSLRRLHLGLAAIVSVVLLLMAGGCSGQSGPLGEFIVSVQPDGGATLKIMAPGSPSDPTKDGLTRGDWDIKTSSAGWTAECNAKSRELDDQSELMILALSSAFENSESFTPDIQEAPSIEIDTSDYFVVKHVTATITFPEGSVEPDECPSCAGSGEQECPDCSGIGEVECATCGGSGSSTCPDCDGGGTEDCYYCDGTGLYEDWWGDTDECYYCDGTGTQDCDNCGGSGEIECYSCWGLGRITCETCGGDGSSFCADCEGSGEPSQEVLDSYKNAVKNSNLKATLDMPGMFVKTADGSASTTWVISGSDALNGEELGANSWVINWLNAGLIIGGLLVVLVGLSAAIIISASRKKRAAAALAPAEPMPSAQPEAPIVTNEDVDSAQEPFISAPADTSPFCTGCGNPLSPTAKFCTNCGAIR